MRYLFSLERFKCFSLHLFCRPFQDMGRAIHYRVSYFYYVILFFSLIFMLVILCLCKRIYKMHLWSLLIVMIVDNFMK